MGETNIVLYLEKGRVVDRGVGFVVVFICVLRFVMVFCIFRIKFLNSFVFGVCGCS